jgi:pseudouridine-5'-phosphate glycosidase
VSAASRFALEIRPPIEAALRAGRPIVALESTLIAHGLPWPDNLETARAAEKAVRDGGAVPATIAVLGGRPTIGLTDAEIERLAKEPGVYKASRRDLPAAVALGQTAATTVAATMALADLSGIQVFATGGIGGAHRHDAWDISADLTELARTPVTVVCAGAKNILNIPHTLEILETLGVPVIGFRCDEFPGFYLRSSGELVSARVETVAEVARLVKTNWALGGKGVVLAQPVAEVFALDASEFNSALVEAERLAYERGIRGPGLTPFLLARIAESTDGKTLRANKELVVANARLGAELASALRDLI